MIKYLRHLYVTNNIKVRLYDIFPVSKIAKFLALAIPSPFPLRGNPNYSIIREFPDPKIDECDINDEYDFDESDNETRTLQKALLSRFI